MFIGYQVCDFEALRVQFGIKIVEIPMTLRLFTSESVSCGHPDKIADQISDAILDACLEQDPRSKVACEVMVSGNQVVIGGEITTNAKVDYEAVARETIRQIGYDCPSWGFDDKSCKVLQVVAEQSADIAAGVEEEQGLFKGQGAGDQGMMFGYACDETQELMPLPITLAHTLVRAHAELRRSGAIPYLGPDAKAQVTIAYDREGTPQHIDTVVLATQHREEATHADVVRDMEAMIRRYLPEELLENETRFYINPTGRFVIGGPIGDCGLTGRKIIVDTYGGMARHGGGAFSGKDPSKVDRSAAYATRYVAKNIVAAGLAKKCELQVAYAIGVPHPVSMIVETFGTNQVPEEEILAAIPRHFDLSPSGIEEMLDLRRPIYSPSAAGGHFGRDQFPWEMCDKAEALRSSLSAAATA